VTTSEPFTWTRELAEQLAWYWQHLMQPRLAGLTDAEYFWEPLPGCWSVRPRGQGVALEVGAGDHIIDFALPEPDPPPVTTISWRLGHLIVGVFGMRNATYFGGPAMSYDTYVYPGTAAAAVDQLTTQVEHWLQGVRALDDDQLRAACGEPGHDHDSMAALVLHIHRELFHHGAEIALLRDLYRARPRQPVDALTTGTLVP